MEHYFLVKFVLFILHEAITFFVTFGIFLIRITLKTMVELLNHKFFEKTFGFKLHGWLVPLKSRTTLPSSVRSELPSAATRPLG